MSINEDGRLDAESRCVVCGEYVHDADAIRTTAGDVACSVECALDAERQDMQDIACPKCGMEFDEERCRRASGCDLCFECAMIEHGPTDAQMEAYMNQGNGTDDSDSYREQLRDAGRGHQLR